MPSRACKNYKTLLGVQQRMFDAVLLLELLNFFKNFNLHEFNSSDGTFRKVFIARQHAYTCRARYCYSKFVRPSVTLWYCIETNAHMVVLYVRQVSLIFTLDIRIFAQKAEDAKSNCYITGV